MKEARMSPTQTETLERTNPLLDYTPMTLSGWDQWMNAWHKAKYAEYRHQLLHVGLDLFMVHEIEAIPFYLRVADGHLGHGISPGPNDFGKFRWHGDHQEKSAGEIRQILARKAFSMLVNKFFGAPSRTRGDLPGWIHSFFSGEILEDVVWFLRCEARVLDHFERWGARNFRISHLHSPQEERAAQAMTDFVVYLAKLAFNRPFFNDVVGQVRSHRDDQEEVYGRLVAVRPQLIEPLSYIGQLDLLLERGVEIDEAWLAELWDLAAVPEGAVLAESVYRHNKAGMVLSNLRIIQQGQKIETAQAEADAAQARAEELRSSTT
jgi:hypothetical protein